MNKSLVVYTVVMGTGYELPDVFADAGVDYICFTDTYDLAPNGWQIRKISPLLPADLVRSSREQKIRPHRWLQDWDRSIYIDSTVQLLQPPQKLWDFLMPQPDTVFGALQHSFRAKVDDEFWVVKSKGFEDRGVLRRQYETYKQIAPEALEQKPVWGGMLARRHNHPDCIEAMEVWFANVLRYSRRDQLSLVLALSGLSFEQCALSKTDNHNSDFHKWPIKGAVRPDRFFGELKAPGRGLVAAYERVRDRILRRVSRLLDR